MTDNDQAAVEAMEKAYDKATVGDYSEQIGIRAIIDAIRAGTVPMVRIAGDEECLPLERERNAKLRAEVEREKARADKAEKRLADYDARLTAVMAPDFKCWHQNSRDEWPEVAAWVINNLRQQIEVEKERADKAVQDLEDYRSATPAQQMAATAFADWQEVTKQRDRLAGLLREISDTGIVIRTRINAELAEVKP